MQFVEKLTDIFRIALRADQIKVFQAIADEDIATVKSMLNRSPQLANRPFASPLAFYRTFPIHLAAQFGNPEILEELLKRGAAPDALNPQGLTAKDIAEREGHESVLHALLVHLDASASGSAQHHRPQ